MFRQSLFAGGEYLEDMVELRRFQDAADIVVDSDQGQVATVGGDSLHRLDEKREAPTVDTLHLVKVDEHSPLVEFGGNADNLARPLARRVGVAGRQ